jgi:hypothetical protein
MSPITSKTDEQQLDSKKKKRFETIGFVYSYSQTPNQINILHNKLNIRISIHTSTTTAQ